MSRLGAHPISFSSDPSLQVQSRSTWEVVRRIARYLLPYPWLVAGTIGCALGSLAGSFAYPMLTQWLVDHVIGGHRVEELPWAAVGLLTAFLARDLANSLRIRLNNTLEQNVIFDIRRELYARLQRMPVGWFDQRTSGDLATRVLEDVNSVERLLIDGTEQGTVALLSLVGGLVVLFLSHARLALVALLPIPFLVGGVVWYTRTAHRRYRAQRQASAAMNSLLMDNLQGVRQVKSFARESFEDQRFADRADALRQGSLTVMKVWAGYSPAMSFVAALGTVAVLYTGGQMVLDHQLTLGGLLKFMGYLALLYEPIGRIHTLNQMLSSARASGERVFDVFDAKSESSVAGSVENSKQLARRPTAPSIVYQGVCASYDGKRSVVEDVSFTAHPGEVVALVGPTGAGKSTLVNLLPRFYELTGGRITIDGTDIREISLANLRDQIAVVSQEPFLFNGTLRENILYGRLGATDAEMEAAARAANCDDFIQRLPQKYDARVGERGIRLSVGEKQRVSIARAILKNAPILILDEATASVDTATERLIQDALERLMQRRTSLVIAHRLGTIRKANQILVIRAGTLVEQGNHDALLSLGGLYHKLWTAQAAAEALQDIAMPPTEKNDRSLQNGILS